MLQFIVGKAASGKTYTALEKIKKLMNKVRKKNKDAKNCTLIGTMMSTTVVHQNISGV